MQLQMTTDYALRIITYMMANEALNRDTLVKAKDMANDVGIDYQYSMKIINKLKKIGAVKSVQGCTGGYYLDESATELTYYDVIKLMEGEIYLLKCFHMGDCTIENKKNCPIKGEFNKLQDDFINMLKGIKIKKTGPQKS